jgi:hypothetical protein
MTFTRTPIELSATASSGLPVSFGVVSGPATIEGSLLRLTGTGSVTVRASQAGDATYASSSIERSFLVMPSYTSWQEQNFTAEELAAGTITGPDVVLTGDGATNFLKYALGLAPRASALSALPQAGVAAEAWTFTYARPTERSDVAYAVEASTDLATWSSEGVTHEFVSAADGVETWRAHVPLALGQAVFFRLKVSLAAPAP